MYDTNSPTPELDRLGSANLRRRFCGWSVWHGSSRRGMDRHAIASSARVRRLELLRSTFSEGDIELSARVHSAANGGSLEGIPENASVRLDPALSGSGPIRGDDRSGSLSAVRRDARN